MKQQNWARQVSGRSDGSRAYSGKLKWDSGTLGEATVISVPCLHPPRHRAISILLVFTREKFFLHFSRSRHCCCCCFTAVFSIGLGPSPLSWTNHICNLEMNRLTHGSAFQFSTVYENVKIGFDIPCCFPRFCLSNRRGPDLGKRYLKTAQCQRSLGGRCDVHLKSNGRRVKKTGKNNDKKNAILFRSDSRFLFVLRQLQKHLILWHYSDIKLIFKTR